MSRYTPQYKQRIAHTCPADYLFYGGAAGGGKSRYLIEEIIQGLIETPGETGFFTRRTYPELRKIIRDSKAIIPASLATYSKKDYQWEFKNWKEAANGQPSVLRFGHMFQEHDVEKYDTDEFGIIVFDEGSHFTPYQLNYMLSRNRSSLPNAWPRYRIGSNPGNISHNYLKKMYIDIPEDVDLIAYWCFDTHRWLAFPPGTRGRAKPYLVWRPAPTEEHIEHGVIPKTRCYIPATVRDNKYIGDDYIANLLELPESKRNALLYGDWDSFDGQFFAEFSEDTHVIDPISPQPHWPKWRGLDHGYYDPLVCIWFTMNPEDGQIIGYRELYEKELVDAKACQLIKDMTPAGEHIDYTVADPAMWRGSSNDLMLNTAMIYQRYGIYLIQGNNARVRGWSRVRDLLAINPETGKPGLVFTRNCVHTIESLPTLVHSETNPEDLHDKHADSHCADTIRYAVMSRGSAAPRKLIRLKAGSLIH